MRKIAGDTLSRYDEPRYMTRFCPALALIPLPLILRAKCLYATMRGFISPQRLVMKLSLIVPCFNEAQSLHNFYTQICATLRTLAHSYAGLESELIFINDGSKDSTLQVLRDMERTHSVAFSGLKSLDSALPLESTFKENTSTPPPPVKSSIKIIDFSRNFGKEAAMYAGLQASSGDCVAIMDADLQDPPELLLEMFRKWQGREAQIIRARRISRAGESYVRARLSEAFYKVSNYVSEVRLESGVRDFRLMDREVVDALVSMGEYHRFSKAMFEWVGFDTISLEYEYIPRAQGRSAWGFYKLFKYAIEGLVSFSTMPLRIAFVLGFAMSVLSLAYGCYAVVDMLIFHSAAIHFFRIFCHCRFCSPPPPTLDSKSIFSESLAFTYKDSNFFNFSFSSKRCIHFFTISTRKSFVR